MRMLNPMQIEEAYQGFAKDLAKWIHDGVQHVDLRFLHSTGILPSLHADHVETDDLTQYFHVVESAEKVTLFNDQFIVWIIPKTDIAQPHTLVLIALNQHDKPQLEIAFDTHGVYNTPQYVLKVLQHHLVDMIETEETITSIEKSQ